MDRSSTTTGCCVYPEYPHMEKGSREQVHFFSSFPELRRWDMLINSKVGTISASRPIRIFVVLETIGFTINAQLSYTIYWKRLNIMVWGIDQRCLQSACQFANMHGCYLSQLWRGYEFHSTCLIGLRLLQKRLRQWLLWWSSFFGRAEAI